MEGRGGGDTPLHPHCVCDEFIARHREGGGEGRRGGGDTPLHPHCVCDEEFIAKHREGGWEGRRGYPTTSTLCVR